MIQKYNKKFKNVQHLSDVRVVEENPAFRPGMEEERAVMVSVEADEAWLIQPS